MAKPDIHDAAAWLTTSGNRYRLILKAAARARELEGWAEPMVPANGDKPLGIALRELAQGKLTS